MFLEANGELELLPGQLKNHTDVLKLRLEIYRETKAWKLMEVVAREFGMLCLPDWLSMILTWSRCGRHSRYDRESNRGFQPPATPFI